jgi:acetyltransferase
MGGAEISAGESVLNGAGIPTFEFPDAAARAFTNMWRYTYNLRGIYETPEHTDETDADREAVEDLIAGVRDSGRTILTEFEAKKLLAAYGIPDRRDGGRPQRRGGRRPRRGMGYPVVLKLDSETITHKTDVGGVRLNLQGADEVREAFEGCAPPSTSVSGPRTSAGPRCSRWWTSTATSS